MFTPLEIVASMVEISHYNFAKERMDPLCYLSLWGGAYSGQSVEIEGGESAVFYDHKARGYLTVEVDMEAKEAKEVALDIAGYADGEAYLTIYRDMEAQIRRGPAGQGADGPIYQISAPAPLVARWIGEQVMGGKSVKAARGMVFY
jgi:hypothetical protein